MKSTPAEEQKKKSQTPPGCVCVCVFLLFFLRLPETQKENHPDLEACIVTHTYLYSVIALGDFPTLEEKNSATISC